MPWPLWGRRRRRGSSSPLLPNTRISLSARGTLFGNHHRLHHCFWRRRRIILLIPNTLISLWVCKSNFLLKNTSEISLPIHTTLMLDMHVKDCEASNMFVIALGLKGFNCVFKDWFTMVSKFTSLRQRYTATSFYACYQYPSTFTTLYYCTIV